MEDSNIVRYDGVCPICGSQDGMVVKGKDGKYRNICRVMGCDAMYKPTPFITRAILLKRLVDRCV